MSHPSSSWSPAAGVPRLSCFSFASMHFGQFWRWPSLTVMQWRYVTVFSVGLHSSSSGPLILALFLYPTPFFPPVGGFFCPPPFFLIRTNSFQIFSHSIHAKPQMFSFYNFEFTCPTFLFLRNVHFNFLRDRPSWTFEYQIHSLIP